MLVVNADDWGRDRENTERILECHRVGTVSSVSAMLFMADSERSAELAREHGVDAGLHLNCTTEFSATNCPSRLLDHQHSLATYLSRSAMSRMVFHPGLIRSFEYVVAAQRDEFIRLYETAPQRFDGHHHMHLSANILLGGLLPSGTLVRRHFSYEPGEKAVRNGIFRRFTNLALARRHHVADYVFSLPPLRDVARLQRIFSLAQYSIVEVETHPINPDEYRYLSGGEIFRHAAPVRIARNFAACLPEPCVGGELRPTVVTRTTQEPTENR